MVLTFALQWAIVGFMADSGLFAVVHGHGISAFPSTILNKTEFRV
jgi:hypothetical protein